MQAGQDLDGGCEEVCMLHTVVVLGREVGLPRNILYCNRTPFQTKPVEPTLQQGLALTDLLSLLDCQ